MCLGSGKGLGSFPVQELGTQRCKGLEGCAIQLRRLEDNADRCVDEMAALP